MRRKKESKKGMREVWKFFFKKNGMAAGLSSTRIQKCKAYVAVNNCAKKEKGKKGMHEVWKFLFFKKME